MKKKAKAKKSKKGRKAAKAAPQVAEKKEGEVIDMQEAIELLKTSRPTFYRWLRSGKIKGMKVGRQWRFYKADIEHFMRGESPRISLAADITPLIKSLDKRLKEAGVKKLPQGDNEVQTAVRRMIAAAVATRASDIHITSHIPEDKVDVQGVLRFRIDGVLHVAAEIDARLIPAIMEEWKRMAACDVYETAKPQDGRIMCKLSDFSPGDKADKVIDLRVSFLPAALGESATVRILDQSAIRLKLDKLGLSKDNDSRIRHAMKLPWGIVVCSGPTGSGKTTTLYSCLQEVTEPGMKVMSVEDPVEYILPWVTQVPVRNQIGLTFKAVLRSMLRSDPDVILVGEIRDLETAQICVQAALTGHLVLSTLHTDSAAAALTRMNDIGVDPFLIADSVKLVIAQRLIRRLCVHCRKEAQPPDDMLEDAAETAMAGGLKWHSLPSGWMEPVGCPKCHQTGFRGRLALMETLEVTPRIARAVRDGAGAEAIEARAVKNGMLTMAANGIQRAAEGQITLRSVISGLIRKSCDKKQDNLSTTRYGQQ